MNLFKSHYKITNNNPKKYLFYTKKCPHLSNGHPVADFSDPSRNLSRLKLSQKLKTNHRFQHPPTAIDQISKWKTPRGRPAPASLPLPLTSADDLNTPTQNPQRAIFDTFPPTICHNRDCFPHIFRRMSDP